MFQMKTSVKYFGLVVGSYAR